MEKFMPGSRRHLVIFCVGTMFSLAPPPPLKTAILALVKIGTVDSRKSHKTCFKMLPETRSKLLHRPLKRWAGAGATKRPGADLMNQFRP
jgi:hypothetical protein